MADCRRGGRRRPGRGGRGRGHHDRGQGDRDHPGPVPAARLPRRPGRGRRRGAPDRAGTAPGRGARSRRDAVPGRDAVLPQAMVKERFGEFAWRKAAGDTYTQDPAWAAASLATARVPILGRVRCNRALLGALAGAMGELRQQRPGRLVDPDAYAGCWNPRLTRGGGGVSRHAWGAAVDLNVAGNPTGLASAQDPRLVDMERWGFTWGGRWLIPDPAHFGGCVPRPRRPGRTRPAGWSGRRRPAGSRGGRRWRRWRGRWPPWRRTTRRRRRPARGRGARRPRRPWRVPGVDQVVGEELGHVLAGRGGAAGQADDPLQRAVGQHRLHGLLGRLVPGPWDRRRAGRPRSGRRPRRCRRPSAGPSSGSRTRGG